MEVGGWNSMEVKYMHSAANYTQTNLTLYQCGIPREDSFHIFRDPVNGDIPWTGAVTGLSVLGMFTWCQDQVHEFICLFIHLIYLFTYLFIHLINSYLSIYLSIYLFIHLSIITIN